jgi:hypothetical protein
VTGSTGDHLGGSLDTQLRVVQSYANQLDTVVQRARSLDEQTSATIRENLPDRGTGFGDMCLRDLSRQEIEQQRGRTPEDVTSPNGKEGALAAKTNPDGYSISLTSTTPPAAFALLVHSASTPSLLPPLPRPGTPLSMWAYSTLWMRRLSQRSRRSVVRGPRYRRAT